MENTAGESQVSEKQVNIIIGVVVVVLVVVFIFMEVAKVNKDNNTSRRATISNQK